MNINASNLNAEFMDAAISWGIVLTACKRVVLSWLLCMVRTVRYLVVDEDGV